MKKIVTSYEEADLDGVASSYAYNEYLNKIGENSDYYIYGTPKKEVLIVCDIFGIKLNGAEEIEENQDVIIMDANNIEEFKFVKPENIIEIIDHHKKNPSCELCIRAKIHIETLGAVATIVAEKFRDNNVSISRESAILLYYAIISNSINLKAKVTNIRDIEMTKWLEKQCSEISKEKIKTIFEQKSQIEDCDLRKEMEAEVVFDYKDKLMIIAQLEVANIEKFLENKKEKILKILEEVKIEKQVDHIFINCVDILNGFNIILTIDDQTEEILNNEFGFEFKNRFCKLDKLMQRKELSKVLRWKK